MKILVIGGSYFLGRVFTMVASSKYELTLLNRGTYSMKEFGVNEIKGDRHDKDILKKIEGDYDCIVDFCAYKKDDIKTILDNTSNNIKRYIFVSTCDVYDRETRVLKNEHYKLNYNTDNYPKEIKKYIDGKVELENELIENSLKKNINYTSVRPGMIYGPYNYSERESYYIKNIVQNKKVIYPDDPYNYFQLVYVKDVADAILELCKSCDNKNAYNLISNESMNYKKLAKIFRKVSDIDYKEVFMNKEDIIKNNIELPFSYSLEESQFYDGSLFEDDFDFEYTPHEEGLQKTYTAFKNVYKK
ncbi:MAG: NAD-dependent epimerase/dehydratase family protein [Bacilli bacterium]|nr:NAD-dependent epimerase/dehydratase family protein [Bacilli bacterium]